LNFQRDSRPLLSIVLVGLAELRDRLTRNVLSSLGARLPVRVHLGPLDAEQVGNYLRHRLRAAGAGQEVFAQDGALLLSKATGGVMRKVDVLAATALEVAAEGKSKLVDASAIEEAIKRCSEALL
jgi:type II secretory pathway predicted ATPase ExeA